METMNISLPEPLKQFVDEQMAQGRYSSVSEYMRELIRADERRKAEDELEAYLLKGLEGPATPFTEQEWIDIRAEGHARAEAMRKEKAGG